jgi:ribonuclease Z
MIRRFGKRVALQKLSAISCIWISHHHADHLLGLISLLHHRASPNRLLLVGPFVALNWLKCFRSNLGSNYIFKHHTHLNRDHTCMNFLRQLGITSFESVPVYHCRDAHAAVFTHQDGWKISFSGDKRPCKAFVEAGKGSTLLIHEATFETKYHSHAVRKKHCTIKEALEIAKEVGAKMTILTHFSQRYPHIPLELNEHIGKEEGKTTPVVAFDGMCIELSRLSEYSEIMPRVSSTLLESVAAESSKR